MGTHGAAGTRALPPGRQAAEATTVNSRTPRRPLPNLSDWPVSRRLFTVIVAALLMGLIFGGLRVAGAESSAAQFSRVSQLANLGQRLVVLTDDLQNERDATLSLLGGAPTQAQLNALDALYTQTNSAVPPVQQAAAGIGGGFPANIQSDATTVLADISSARIGELHKTLNSPQDELAVIADYGADISDMINLADQVSQGVSDASLASDVRAFNALALAKEEVSQQRALLNFGFTNLPANGGDLDANTTAALPVALDQELTDEASFQQVATPAEQTFFDDSLGGPATVNTVAMAENLETNIIDQEGTPTGNNTTPTVLEDVQALGGDIQQDQTRAGGKLDPGVTPPLTIAQAQADWQTGISDELNAMQSTETIVAGNIASRASQLQSGAQQSALISGIITAVVLLVVLLAALLVARSLVLPLRRLRAGALNIASVQLPERVRLLSESPDAAATMEVAPINVTSEDEIGQVARAFDQVHAEAVRLAGEQALLRSSFNAMFVNLSRRSQSLIERLARMIDNLEQNEDDPDRLGSLFSMDHLVTRMRRNSENLLLLAGHENPRKWSDAIPLADIARAATSEIEQYNRVTLNIPPGISVIGPAVSDIVHLLAELIENATIFSPKDTQVLVVVQELTSGGVLIEVIDKGIGVSDVRLADMNWRLDNPPTIDVSVSRHMGLFAVARLAERHRVRVRLRPASPQGLSALVWLPDGVIERAGGLGATGSWSARPVGAQPHAGARELAGQGVVAFASDGQVSEGYGNGNGSPAGRTPSGWFRGGAGPGGTGPSPVAGAGNGRGPGISPDWGEVRHPAGIVGAQAGGDQTIAGLPVRVSKASVGSGSGTPDSQGAIPASGTGNGRGTPNGSRSLPQRSPEHARSRLTGFQRGARRAEGQGGSGGQAPRAGEGTER
jgi:signal transduction histidine kinase